MDSPLDFLTRIDKVDRERLEEVSVAVNVVTGLSEVTGNVERPLKARTEINVKKVMRIKQYILYYIITKCLYTYLLNNFCRRLQSPFNPLLKPTRIMLTT